MKTQWDYTQLADAYLKRPDYAGEALDQLFALCGVGSMQNACDIGAGVAHLTLHLATRHLDVVAVEPNNAMRVNGMQRTHHLKNVTWVEAGGEDTGLADASFDLVTFGSSFNVMDRAQALRETHRLLRPGGWFFCLWNHRVLTDPIQKAIEDIIRDFIPSYGYGVRREDQGQVIADSGLFEKLQKVEGNILHRQTVVDCVEAWRSHATLERQAKEAFPAIVQKIENYLVGLNVEAIEVPYTTRAWIARRKDLS